MNEPWMNHEWTMNEPCLSHDGTFEVVSWIHNPDKTLVKQQFDRTLYHEQVLLNPDVKTNLFVFGYSDRQAKVLQFLLAPCWHRVCTVFGTVFGSVLAPYWRRIWHRVGTVFAPCWRRIWHRVGTVFAPCLSRVGAVLGLFNSAHVHANHDSLKGMNYK